MSKTKETSHLADETAIENKLQSLNNSDDGARGMSNNFLNFIHGLNVTDTHRFASVFNFLLRAKGEKKPNLLELWSS
jgi:hypothetical protein